MTEAQKTALKKLAAEMAQCVGMPPLSVGDWDLPQKTPASAQRKISSVSEIADAQCRNWSRRIVELVDADR
jgi:hypothetical protein